MANKALVLGAATVGGVMVYSGIAGVPVMDVLAGKASLKDLDPRGGKGLGDLLTRSASTGGVQTENALNIKGRIPKADIQGKTPKQIIDVYVLPLARKHGIAITPASVDAANGRHGPTITGGRSDHQGPPEERWAMDASGTKAQMAGLAADLARLFGIKWDGSGAMTVRLYGYRIQLIHNSMVGGNHYTHVHLGIEG